jgi:hypothetical protein
VEAEQEARQREELGVQMRRQFETEVKASPPVLRRSTTTDAVESPLIFP